MEPNFENIKEIKTFNYDQGTEKNEGLLPPNKTANVSKEIFSEKDYLLPDQTSKKSWRSIQQIFNKKEKEKVVLTPKEEFKKTLKNIKKTILYFEASTGHDPGKKMIEELLKFLKDSKGDFINEEKSRNFIKHFGDSYINSNKEHKNELIKTFKECWVTEQK